MDFNERASKTQGFHNHVCNPSHHSCHQPPLLPFHSMLFFFPPLLFYPLLSTHCFTMSLVINSSFPTLVQHPLSSSSFFITSHYQFIISHCCHHILSSLFEPYQDIPKPKHPFRSEIFTRTLGLGYSSRLVSHPRKSLECHFER